MKDYYSILGINEYATSDQIKSAYRTRTKIWHPDVCSHKDAKEKFMEIVEAYEILIDQDKRKKYDDKRNEETDLQQVEERPTTLFGCVMITLLVIISLIFISYIAFEVYSILQGL